MHVLFTTPALLCKRDLSDLLLFCFRAPQLCERNEGLHRIITQTVSPFVWSRSCLKLCFVRSSWYLPLTADCSPSSVPPQSTTLILWVPLIVTCVIQLVFSSRCLSVCVSFLGLPCCRRHKKRPKDSRVVRFGLSTCKNISFF